MTEQHFEYLNLKGGCTGSSESTLVKMPHCWKSYVAAHFISGYSRVGDGQYAEREQRNAAENHATSERERSSKLS